MRACVSGTSLFFFSSFFFIHSRNLFSSPGHARTVVKCLERQSCSYIANSLIRFFRPSFRSAENVKQVLLVRSFKHCFESSPPPPFFFQRQCFLATGKRQPSVITFSFIACGQFTSFTCTRRVATFSAVSALRWLVT